jgi:hypothetical protein
MFSTKRLYKNIQLLLTLFAPEKENNVATTQDDPLGSINGMNFLTS